MWLHNRQPFSGRRWGCSRPRRLVFHWCPNCIGGRRPGVINWPGSCQMILAWLPCWGLERLGFDGPQIAWKLWFVIIVIRFEILRSGTKGDIRLLGSNRVGASFSTRQAGSSGGKTGRIRTWPDGFTRCSRCSTGGIRTLYKTLAAIPSGRRNRRRCRTRRY